MISEPTYLAARIVAPTIEAHFEQHIATARALDASELVTEPSVQLIEAVIDCAFWASLRHEEGRSPKISMALLPSDTEGRPLLFERRIRLTPQNLTKLAPALEGPGLYLGIWHDEKGLYIWGTLLHIPSICFVLEVIEPGLLVIKHRRIDGFGKFINVAILKGGQIKIVDEQSSSLTDCPALLTSLLGMPLPTFLSDSVNVLIELAASMRAHGRGGCVLVVPCESEAWRTSIVHPITYPIVPIFSGITELMEQETQERTHVNWQEALRKVIDVVGNFTAVDGATILNQKHELLAFGAKITRAQNNELVNQIIVTEPIVGGTADLVYPGQMGGTRHMSAAQFVHDQHDALALVASQDGRFTIFMWSDELKMVHAHRIDILLL